MRILIATDAFPPVCGGSGWSTYELARGLRSCGHEITIVQPKPGSPSGMTESNHDGFRVRHWSTPAPNIPFVRNYFKNERLYVRFDRVLREIIRADQIDIVHGQHVLTGPPAIAAARAEGVPVVCTVRDYWPVCYWSDLILDYRSSGLCPGCSQTMMTRCIRPRAGAAWPLALPMIPYMWANLARKRHVLSYADAVVAVSSTIAGDLRERAPELARTRIETIPNPVDAGAIRAAVSARAASSPTSPYAIFVGKLAPNKGVRYLVPAIQHAQLPWPLVVVGDGPERSAMEHLAATRGCDVRFLGWLPREEALGWLRDAALLIFPSHGPESLSRVLLEASVLGVPIAAMDTGGTRDIVIDEVTGLLSMTAEGLGTAIGRLVNDPALRLRLGEGARRVVETRFSAPAVVRQIEALYRELADRRIQTRVESVG